MFADILTNTLGQLLGELFGETLEQKLDQRQMLRQLSTAVLRAEERFRQSYQDRALAEALTTQTRFADLPSVQTALRTMLTRPFNDPSSSIKVLQQSFIDVLPEQMQWKVSGGYQLAGSGAVATVSAHLMAMEGVSCAAW